MTGCLTLYLSSYSRCRLEIQLDDANTVFRQLLSDSTHHLKSLSKRLGNCIEKARPYYESVDQMTRAQVCEKYLDIPKNNFTVI